MYTCMWVSVKGCMYSRHIMVFVSAWGVRSKAEENGIIGKLPSDCFGFPVPGQQRSDGILRCRLKEGTTPSSE